MPEETAPVAAPAGAPQYTFPFEVPADLTTASEETLRTLHGQVRDHSQSLRPADPGSLTQDQAAGLQACATLARQIREEIGDRNSRQSAANDAIADVDADLPDPVEPASAGGDDGDGDAGDGDAGGDGDGDGDDADPEPVPAVTAATRRPAPGVRQVASRGGAPRLPAQATNDVYAEMVVADAGLGFQMGQRLTKFADAARALDKSMSRFPVQSAGRPSKFSRSKRPITVYDPETPGRALQLRNYARQSVIEIRRQFPEELRVREDGSNGYAIAEFAASERRLAGGSLLSSYRADVKKRTSLTAAAGWCAPSPVIYDLLEMETLDGILDLPELQTTRGGWQIPEDGGPDFATIFSSIGNAGVTHLTETQVINDTSKVCVEIPCPDFEDVRLGVDYFCLTGSLLQRRGYPEVVARWGRGATVGLAHKINYGVIAAIILASTAVTIPQDPNGDDAASAVLSAIELAVWDIRYRNRMGLSTTLEAVFPAWVVQPIRAGLARRTGVAMMAVTDAQIVDWFTLRGVVPRFVYDWQDAGVGLATGPGGAAPLTRLPATGQFCIYPAGTWVKPVQDVVALDTIYDSTQLETNQYTAMFVEDGWAVLQMSPISRVYTVNLDPGGVTGCCDTVGS